MNNNYPRTYIPAHNIISRQNMDEQIDYQISQLQQMKEQMRNQQPAINQTFQLAPNGHNDMKYVNTIEDVAKEQVFFDTPFFSKEMSVVWIKKANGQIESYELNKIIPKDEKDMQIEYLQSQIEELKGMIKNEQSTTNVNAEQTTADTTTDNTPIREPIKKNEPSSVQRVPASKKR